MDTGYRPRVAGADHVRDEAQAQNTAANWLPLLLAAYFTLAFIMRLSLPDSLEFDESEQVLTAQWLAAGYGTQPPFYNWMQQLAFSLGGVSIATISALKNLMLFSIYLSYWYTARLVFRRTDLALIATLGLMTIPQVVFESQRDLTHTVAVIFSASLFLWALFATLTRPSLTSYIGLGIATGFGLLSKYNFALLPAATFFAALLDAEARKGLFDKRFLLTILVSIGLLTPHLFWLINNFELASANTIIKMRGDAGASWLLRFGTGLLSILKAVIGFSGLTLLVFLGLFGRSIYASLSAQGRWTRFTEHLLLGILACLVLIIATVGAGSVKDRWLSPLLIILPLYLVMKLHASGALDRLAWKRMLHLALAVMLLVPSILYVRVEAARWTGIYQKLNVPYHTLADRIVAQAAMPSLVIADNTWIGGNLRYHLQDVPVFSPQFSQFQPRFNWTLEHPIIAVWQSSTYADRGLPTPIANLIERFAGHDARVEIRSLELPYDPGRAGDVISFSYAVVTPTH
ncbi:glycosyltransferase family 39 protein [Rhizobium helianthi]|uniref:Glycosyltransferase family 39 protein n=1 Tax=Rhizobium helianthi TaxID=1132695 RepID=A0ABW4M5T9_9HYPH